jgi:P63C domain
MPAEQVCLLTMSEEPTISKHASQGGRARASVLTSEERKQIARTAARARWGEKKDKQASPPVVQPAGGDSQQQARLPIAVFPGKVSIGDGKYLCYVLDNHKRVISQREVVRALTDQSKGDISRYLETQNLKPFISSKLIADQTIQFTIPGNPVTANGYEATLLLDICDGYLRARDVGMLSSSQMQLARKAEIIVRACAKVGIIALVDEATGYQQFRQKQELQLKLQAFIADQMQEWARMFPEEFWLELARLEGVHYSPRSRPLRWGRYVMMFVYDAMDADVGKELRKKNPDPHFLQNHHQWLKKFGRDKVHDQITKVVTVMKLCDDMNGFRRKFSRLFDRQMSFAGFLSE